MNTSCLAQLGLKDVHQQTIRIHRDSLFVGKPPQGSELKQAFSGCFLGDFSRSVSESIDRIRHLYGQIGKHPKGAIGGLN
ncbi:hypothetical protein [uncultured Endozoicomonas sp.]|uniref:hypothetical protein n=1 Tax=uncultured Endozoicomonas sp. TaxID=432652 RepID=UPI00260E884E|nr:hypothetical protein [uncultured Endozoicomonas sp.]